MLLATAATESNFQNTFKSFGIEASPIAFDILSSKLYSNTTLAIVREILSNAYDAMAEAGTLETKKIDVHFPDMLESRFIVRDYGNGLSEEEVFNLYTTFFQSTKRDSNEFTGCYGLGSKSPFAYGDSFMVESFQDGIVKKYLMAKMNGYPKVTKLTEKETDEDNGLKVTIPVPEGVKDFYYEFCKYVKYQPDLAEAVNANMEFNHVEFCKEYTDSFCTVRLAMEENPYRLADIYIKQGMNIFPFKNDISTFGFTTVVEVPIGTFEIVPSREALSECISNTRNFGIVKNSIQKVMANILGEFEPHSLFVYNSYLHEPIAKTLRDKYFFYKSYASGYTYYRDTNSIGVQRTYKETKVQIAYTGYIPGVFEIKSYMKDPFSISNSSVRDDRPMIIVVGKEEDPDWSKVKRKMSTYPDFKELNICVKGFSYDYWQNHGGTYEYPICLYTLINDTVVPSDITPRDALQYLRNIVWTYNNIPELNFDIQIMPIHTFLNKFKGTTVPKQRKTPSAPVNTLVGVMKMTSYSDPVPLYFRECPLSEHLNKWDILGVTLKKDLPSEVDLRAICFMFNNKTKTVDGDVAVYKALENQEIHEDFATMNHVLVLSSRGYKQALELGLKPIDFNKIIEDLRAMPLHFYLQSSLMEIGELKIIDSLFTENTDIRRTRNIKLPIRLVRRLKQTMLYRMHRSYMSIVSKVANNTLEYSHEIQLIKNFFENCPNVKICKYENKIALPRLHEFYGYLSKRQRSYAFPSVEEQYKLAEFILNNRYHL